jgi:uncharacterized protein (DUF433 family)
MENDWRIYITSNPHILYGKPAIKGTRISVDLILEKLACGETIEQILNSYPNLKSEMIYACLAFASESLRNEKIFNLS